MNDQTFIEWLKENWWKARGMWWFVGYVIGIILGIIIGVSA